MRYLLQDWLNKHPRHPRRCKSTGAHTQDRALADHYRNRYRAARVRVMALEAQVLALQAEVRAARYGVVV